MRIHTWISRSRFDRISLPRLHTAVFIAVAPWLFVVQGCASTPQQTTVLNPPYTGPVTLSPVEWPRIGLVLGGGAVRGFAHVGVIRALERAGIEPDIVVGTSAGSIVGAMYAGGIRGEELVRVANDLERSEVTDFVASKRGVIVGEQLQSYINRLVNDTPIEKLETVFAAVATDLGSGERMVFTHGNTGLAVRASTSVPGIFQPAHVSGRDYIDGGIVSPVPIRAARELGADIVVAVDVSKTVSPDRELNGPYDVIHQSFLIMTQALVESEVHGADVLIRPDVSKISFAGFDQREQAMKAGEMAAAEVVPLLEKVIEEWKTRRE